MTKTSDPSEPVKSARRFLKAIRAAVSHGVPMIEKTTVITCLKEPPGESGGGLGGFGGAVGGGVGGYGGGEGGGKEKHSVAPWTKELVPAAQGRHVLD